MDAAVAACHVRHGAARGDHGLGQHLAPEDPAVRLRLAAADEDLGA